MYVLFIHIFRRGDLLDTVHAYIYCIQYIILTRRFVLAFCFATTHFLGGPSSGSSCFNLSLHRRGDDIKTGVFSVVINLPVASSPVTKGLWVSWFCCLFIVVYWIGLP